MSKIILASASPRRKELLEMTGIPFEIVTTPTDETIPTGMNSEEIAIHIAREKAIAVKNKFPGKSNDSIIIAADTIVLLNGEILGKPKDRQDAIAMLEKLSGNTHQVITGVFIYADPIASFASNTSVTFTNLSAEQIKFYVDRFLPFDKAGSYAIQEWIGLTGIASIHGDYYNVVGLPVCRLLQELRKYAIFPVI